MSDFDDRFADRAREVFDAYGEPVDPAALARMRAALGHAPAGPAPAPDRPPAPAPRSVRRWRGLVVALAVGVVAGGIWLQTAQAPRAPVAAGPPLATAGQGSASGPSSAPQETRSPSAEPPPALASAASGGERDTTLGHGAPRAATRLQAASGGG